MVPLSLIFEIVFLSLAFILLDYHMVGRIIAIGSFMFEIKLLTDPQVYIVESGGVVSTTTVALPATILATLVFIMVLLTYFAIANFLEWMGRDIVGRKPGGSK